MKKIAKINSTEPIDDLLFYKQIVDFSSEGIHIHDHEGNFVLVNDAFCSMHGYLKKEVEQLTLFDIVKTVPKEALLNHFKEVQSLKRIERFYSKHLKKDGSFLDVEIMTKEIILNNNSYFYASARDISEQKRLEKQLLKAQEIANFGSYEFDIVKDKWSSSPILDKLFGIDENYPKNATSWLEIVHPDDQQMMSDYFIHHVIGQKERFDKSYRIVNRITQEVKWVHGKGKLSYDNSNNPSKLYGIIQDITLNKLLESQSKLASMGEMIGNIAHQWRQPLSVISTSATGLMMQQEFGLLTEQKLNDVCTLINNHAQYLSKTIDDFRNFIRGNTSLGKVKISLLIDEILNLIQATFSQNFITLEVMIDDDLEIDGNKNELQQAIINILNNAKDAILEISQLEEKVVLISTKKIDENTLELKIQDNGGGIKPNIIEKIFEPYFTTKHQSQGTGLGLSMVYKIIIERHNQKINVTNEEFLYKNKKFYGACFTMTFSI